ncbi:TetR/AcrR family transcriptional regulator [Luteimonas sp. R10]|uniref:TetR/AcrR family transcriptional regulator n=1 Tax=Luteimonas sp. R10 TaxID=3108176 RepID=UPI00308E6445|nr:TetR/AcrR family transcriptional regulator [Luteimonas sp. R10]
MPRPRFLKLDETRREQVLETAGEEFAAHGYDQASLNRIIERLGLSKGQFYYYFDDKIDLFQAVMDWAWALGVPEEIGDFSHLQADTFWPTLERLSERSRALLRERPWYVGVWRPLYHPPADERAQRIAQEKIEQINAIRRTFMRHGQKIGCIRSDMPEDLLLAAIFGLRGALDRWFVDHWDELSAEQKDTLPRLMLDMFRRMFEPT